CLVLAWWRLRPAYLRQLEALAPRTGRLAWQEPPPDVEDEEPLRWKEQYVEGIAPLAALRKIPTWLGFLLVTLGSVAVAGGLIWWLNIGSVRLSVPRVAVFELWLAFFFVLNAVVCVRAATAVSGERERRTWDDLLLTPLTAQELIEQKQQGIVAA